MISSNLSTLAATTAIVIISSAAVYWRYYRCLAPDDATDSDAASSDNTLGSPVAVEGRGENEKEGKRQLPVVKIKSLYSSSKMQEEQRTQTEEEKPKTPLEPENQQTEEDMEAFKKAKISINDLPEFTIELDDSDNDML